MYSSLPENCSQFGDPTPGRQCTCLLQLNGGLCGQALTHVAHTHMSFISFFLFFFLRQGLFSSGYPRTLGVHQAGLKFRDPPACLTSARTEGIHLHAQQSSFFLTISETRKETFWKWGSHSTTHSLYIAFLTCVLVARHQSLPIKLDFSF